MPGGDGTGPMRLGPITGRGFGPCGTGRGREMDIDRGQGRGVGVGRGRGRRNRQWAPLWSAWRPADVRRRTDESWSPGAERDELQRDEAALEAELALIKARITELDQAD